MDLSYVAALFDGEGCFSISIYKRISSSGRPFIQVGAHAGISMKTYTIGVLNEIRDFLGIGKLYYKNKNKKTEMLVWQTTNWAELKLFIDKIKDHCKIKNKQANMMLEAYEVYYEKYSNKINKNKNRSKEDMIALANIALAMNKEESLNALRRNQEKGIEYLTNIINEVYDYNDSVEKDIGGAPSKYTDERLFTEISKIIRGDYNWEKDRKWKELAKYRFGSWELAVSKTNEFFANKIDNTKQEV